MVKRRVNILRNKKGHPIYSREDIREQYCINRKEAEVLENARTSRMFGCLTGQQDTSCSRSSLFSCMSKKKASSVENVSKPLYFFRKQEGQIESGGVDKGSAHGKGEGKMALANSVNDEDDDDNEEFAKAGFRRRPKSFCAYDPKVRLSGIDKSFDDQNVSVVATKLFSSFSANQNSINIEYPQIEQSRDSLVGKEVDTNSAPSLTPDIIKDSEIVESKAEELSLDERRQKHVSFDSASLQRNHTVIKLVQSESGPLSTSTPLNQQKLTSVTKEQSKSQERLLDTPLKKAPQTEDFTVDIVTHYDSYFGLSTSSLTGSVIQLRPRKVPTKTQATQTDKSAANRVRIPAYLTLSPRASVPLRQRHRGVQHRGISKLTKSQSSYGNLGSDEDSDEDLMEIDVISKHHRLIRPLRGRTISKQRSIDLSSEEIIVSFKPNSPITRGFLSKNVSSLLSNTEANSEKRFIESTIQQKLLSHSSVHNQTPRELLTPSSVGVIRKKRIPLSRSLANDGEDFIIDVSSSSVKSKILKERKVPVRRHSTIEHEPLQTMNNPTILYSTEKSNTMASSATKTTIRFENSVPNNQHKNIEEKFSLALDDTHFLRADVEGFSVFSDESPTMTSDVSLPDRKPNQLFETKGSSKSPVKERYPDNIVRRMDRHEMLTSPESESSSSHFTERETSQSEVSTSSSYWLAKKEASLRTETECEEASESSEYMTANEHSNREKGTGINKMFFHKKIADSNDICQNSFESTSSSTSVFGSPSSRFSNHRTSSSFSLKEAQNELIPQQPEQPDHEKIRHNSEEEIPLDETTNENLDSSDDSTKKGLLSSDSELQEVTHTLCKAEMQLFSQKENDKEFPLKLEHSPDHSSLLEATTVIEKSDGTSEDLVESLHESPTHKFVATSDHELCCKEHSHAEKNTISDEKNDLHFSKEQLLAVKEVSETLSESEKYCIETDELTPVTLKQDTENSEKSSSLNLQNFSTTTEYFQSETTTPSFDSTASGSCFVDNVFETDPECSHSQSEEVAVESVNRLNLDVEITDLPRSFEDSVDLQGIENFINTENLKQRLERTSSPKPDDVSSVSLNIEKDIISSRTTSVTESVFETDSKDSPSTSVTSLRKESEASVKKKNPDLVKKKDRFRVTINTTELNEETRRNDPLRRSHSLNRGNNMREECPPFFLCSHCGDRVKDQNRNVSSLSGDWLYSRQRWDFPQTADLSSTRKQQERDRQRFTGTKDIFSFPHSRLQRWCEGSTIVDEDVLEEDDEDRGLHLEGYHLSLWIFVGEKEELAVWKQLVDSNKEAPLDSEAVAMVTRPTLHRSESSDSTTSEREFRNQYQSVTHKLIHRKSSMELYKRLSTHTLEVDKTVTVQRSNEEFGFRIHGSRPVVVSAIEKGTPAESCGLEVGDIIISINGIKVLDASHSEVVKTAHTGCDTLCLEVARTYHLMESANKHHHQQQQLLMGYLQRLSTGRGETRRWCRRWFVLKSDNCLYWYKTQKDSIPVGALLLNSHIICRVSDSESPHSFRVSKKGVGDLYLTADEEETATRWISALNQVASSASQVDPFLEDSIKNMYYSPLSITVPDCHGYLGRLGRRWKTCKRRYFVLKNASLYVYLDRSSQSAIGLFQLHGYKFQTSSVAGKKHTFEAIPPDPRLRNFCFVADTENDKKRWLAALEYSVDRWIKVG